MSDAQRDAVRLSKDVRRQLLEQNDGFTTKTHYKGKNFSEVRTYEIRDGELHIDSNSNTSWADSRQRSEHVADQAATHRFLYNNLDALDQDGVVPRASRPKAKVKAKVKPVAADTSDSDAQSRFGADADGDTDTDADTYADTYDGADGDTKDKSGLTPGLVIAITVVLTVTAAVTVAGVAVWKKAAKPALERRRAARAEQKAAEERAQVEEGETPDSAPDDEG